MNSIIYFVGILSDMAQTGTLRVNVESIALNVGREHDANSMASTPTTTPVKKRKFATFATLPMFVIISVSCLVFYSFNV